MSTVVVGSPVIVSAPDWGKVDRYSRRKNELRTVQGKEQSKQAKVEKRNQVKALIRPRQVALQVQGVRNHPTDRCPTPAS